jgi:hypothetical protein
LAAAFPDRYDSAASARLIGLPLDQDDDPWWLADALCWLAMYQAIMGAWGKAAAGLRAQFEVELQRRPPSFLYEFYPRWADVMRREGMVSGE